MAARLTDLPLECQLDIFGSLAVADILALGCTCRAARTLCASEDLWRRLAVRKWGQAAADLKPADTAWMSYAWHRLSLRSIRRSPLQLAQEEYPDPWQHICSCVMCSRTSGSKVIRDTIAAFFELCPTPTAVMAAEDAALRRLLHPLGLLPARLTALRSIAHGFLATDWAAPSEFYGCGRFVDDSWAIFCRGLADPKRVDDAHLRRYLAWAKHAGSGGDAEEVEGEAATGRKRRRQQASQPGKRGPGGARQKAEKAAAGGRRADKRADAGRGSVSDQGRVTGQRAAAAAERPEGARVTRAAAAGAAASAPTKPGGRRGA